MGDEEGHEARESKVGEEPKAPSHQENNGSAGRTGRTFKKKGFIIRRSSAKGSPPSVIFIQNFLQNVIISL
jgi:hypothetical protein